MPHVKTRLCFTSLARLVSLGAALKGQGSESEVLVAQ